MHHQKARRLSTYLFVGSVLTSFCLYGVQDIGVGFTIVIALTFLLMGAGFYVLLRYYRCPHCSSLLPTRSWAEPRYCPNCGKPLDGEE